MTENKTLTRFTNGMLIFDVLISLWDTGLATYNFIKGRWIAGLCLVAVVALLLWTVRALLKTKHEAENMRLWFEYLTKSHGIRQDSEDDIVFDA